jgi:tRNA 2-(methylsulfanyl)-N6-isopentenyladenosine37 hydroxylase
VLVLLETVVMLSDIELIKQFLLVETPVEWLLYAAKNVDLLLIDHAHCERKAAATALNFMSKYPEKEQLLTLMSPLAREELLHFEKVLQLLKKRNITFGALKPSRYAQALHQKIARTDYLLHLTHELIVGAIIEARSCERFHALEPYIEDTELRRFYSSLFKAEARHFENYLMLAQNYCPTDFQPQLQKFLELEKDLIVSQDTVFRFHGGLPPSPNDNRG